ncbi:MAG TPA: M48 family metallopeptidase [Candidatus Hodarchaeales archaeon]|nr:M48 family metallopeptidase [Candidatus Hodarchaeales archaeon]
MIRSPDLQKWLNLFAFLILDLSSVAILSSITTVEPSKSILGFDFVLSINPVNTIVFLLIIYLIRAGVSFWILMRIFQRPAVFQIHPQIGFDDIPIGRFNGKLLREWTLETATKLRIRPRNIFIARTAIPNAYTLDFGIPFVYKKSYIVINSNIARILNENEMKAVISHELGHIRNSDSIIRLILSGPHFFLQIAYLLLYLRMIIGIANALVNEFDAIIAFIRFLVLLVIVVIATIVSDVAVGFLRKSNRMSEFIADQVALRTMGPGPTINMLIKLGQRTDVLETLKNELVWLEKRDGYKTDIRRLLILELLETFPESEIDNQKARQDAAAFYLKKSLLMLKEQYYLDLFSTPNVEEKIQEASKRLFEERSSLLKGKSDDQEKPKGTEKHEQKYIDWQDFDANKDYFLDDSEIREFIKYIRANPKIMYSADRRESGGTSKNHPSFRKRILNIAGKVGYLE